MTPKKVATLETEALRACGLSFQKIGYIQNIASAFLSGALSEAFLCTADDAAVIQALTAIKGIGQWTAEMFLIFCLGREDVFSYGDLGLRKGMAWLYDTKSTPSPEFARAVNALWSPYNSTASLYLWEVTIQSWFGKDKNEILYPEFWGIPGETDYLHAPFGAVKIVSSSRGLIEVRPCPSEKTTHSTCPLIQETKKQLSEYFCGDRRVFDLPLAFEGSESNRSVWAALRTLPFGQTANAKTIALRTGFKTTPQAVNAANQKNRLQIIVPSHRLTRADGRINKSLSKMAACA